MRRVTPPARPPTIGPHFWVGVSVGPVLGFCDGLDGVGDDVDVGGRDDGVGVEGNDRERVVGEAEGV